MQKRDDSPRFGPGQWVTMRDTGEHVKIEAWSPIAAAYRVRSRKHGLQFAGADDLEEVSVHPEVHLGKHWSRCQAPGCGAPLTPELPLCPQCQAPKCACGRCLCARPVTKAAQANRRVHAKTTRPKSVSRAQ